LTNRFLLPTGLYRERLGIRRAIQRVTSGAAVAVLQRKATAIVNIADFIAPWSYHFVVAVWSKTGRMASRETVLVRDRSRMARCCHRRF
jgi:hypothetical protein